MVKFHYEQVSDFVRRWSSDMAGRYEFLSNGQQIVVYDCHLSYDLASRPDRIWVNDDSKDQPKFDFDPADVVTIYDREQEFALVELNTPGASK